MGRTGGTDGGGPHVGHFVPWSGGCPSIGRAGGVIPLHARHAIQIAVGSASGIRVRAGEREAWAGRGGAIIPSGRPHALAPTRVPPGAAACA
jgi:hypothetical protein